MLHTVFGPLTRLQQDWELNRVQTYARQYWGIHLDNSQACFSFAKNIFDELEGMLEDKKTLLSDAAGEKLDATSSASLRFSRENCLKISFLDLLAYAFLQEVIINTPESSQADYLQKKCPNLQAFICRMKLIEEGGQVVTTPQRIGIKSFVECSRIFN